MVRQVKIHMQNLLDEYRMFCQYHGISYDEAMIPFMKILELQRLDFSTYRIPELVQTHMGDFLKIWRKTWANPWILYYCWPKSCWILLVLNMIRLMSQE